jgi:3-oxoacyl-[acyl-carrier-protein] synthase-3
MQTATIITGTGAYIPTEIVPNKDFELHNFYAEDHTRIETPPLEVTEKLQLITGISERRYASAKLNTSDIGAMAALKAIEDSGIAPETIDQLIVAHNFGNVMKDTIQTDAVPSLANRIKHILGIRNPKVRGSRSSFWLSRLGAGCHSCRRFFQGRDGTQCVNNWCGDFEPCAGPLRP